MNEHFYYALKHFCKQEVLRHTLGFSEEYWSTQDWLCEYYIEHWECEYDPYIQKFSYYKWLHKKLSNKIEVCDNYHTERLYRWLIKR